ncbi:C40 family peptidase [Arcanobacterium bovis]|nr:NlpC/P60 family protein [Arcanobacterium bovis]
MVSNTGRRTPKKLILAIITTALIALSPFLHISSSYAADSKGTTSHISYHAPYPYLQVTDHITSLGNATNTLTPGFNGVKVKIVQQKLGIWYEQQLASMDDATIAAVRSFQRRVGLPATGVVDETTWKYMNTGWMWRIDTYQATPVPLWENREQRINAMIRFASQQIGSSYTWGGAGFYALGFDCSGLMLQTLYRGGLDPQPINVLLHAYPDYRTSQELYKYPHFKHVPVEKRERGDIVFYTDRNGQVIHTALYIGNDQIIHTDWMGRPARIDTVFKPRIAPTAIRPFPREAS